MGTEFDSDIIARLNERDNRQNKKDGPETAVYWRNKVKEFTTDQQVNKLCNEKKTKQTRAAAIHCLHKRFGAEI